MQLSDRVGARGLEGSVYDSLVKKLNPARFSGMSPKMAAIVGCILDVRFTNPHLMELYVTSDRCVLGRMENDCGANVFIGSEEDLDRNWRSLLDAADLTEEERELAERAKRDVVVEC